MTTFLALELVKPAFSQFLGLKLEWYEQFEESRLPPPNLSKPDFVILGFGKLQFVHPVSRWCWKII